MYISKIILFAMTMFFVARSYATTDMHRLIWNDDPATTITVGWRQIHGEAKVYYDVVDHGLDYSAYSKSQEASKKNNHLELNSHFCNIKQLLADTKYYFIIADGKSVSKRYFFKTAPAKLKDFNFIAGGDTKSSNKKSAYISGRMSNRMVAKLRPLFVLFVGDYTSDSDVASRWVEWFNDWDADTCSTDGRMYPIIPVHGNHESPNGLKDLKNLFDTPKTYYNIDFCDNFMRILVLNTQFLSKGLKKRVTDTSKKFEVQTKWVEETLKNSSNFKYRLAMYHKPMRPHTSRKGYKNDTYNAWAPLFAKYKLNLSFDGDSHLHKITYPLIHDAKGEDGFSRDDINGTMFIGEGS